MSSESLFIADNPGKDMGLGLLGALTSTTDSNSLLEASAPLRVLIQQMLSVYSSAVLTIAGFIVLYYFVLVVVDAAQTGKAFRRINPLWGPIRLILAMGLLVPMGDGLNGGQRIVVQLSEWGSGLASSLWELAMADTKVIRPMIARPRPVPATPLVRALILRDTCILLTTRYASEAQQEYNKALRAHKESPELTGPPSPPALQTVSEQPQVSNADGSLTTPYGWKERPYFCGGVTVYPVTSAQEGQMFGLIKRAHLTALKATERRSSDIASDYLRVAGGEQTQSNFTVSASAQRYEEELSLATGRDFTSAAERQLDQARQQLGVLGWVGAPAYLDTLLRMNVRLISLNASLPQVDPPELLLNPPAPGTSAERRIYDLLRGVDASWGEQARTSPLSAAGLGGISTLLSHAVTVAREVGGAGSTGHQLRAARDLLRTNDYDWANFASRNPLVGLSELGSYLTGKSIELLAGAGVLQNVGPVTGPTVAMITTLGILAFVISVALLLLVPLIPLMRFLLGLAIWLLEVFEALLAIPLVALAHLRADENGIAGASAVLCYLMILKIILRPALMVFGLMGGLVIFLIMLSALNTLVAGTMPGVVDSGQVASLWFVLVSGVYAVLVLGLANACFKLIDWLPQRTLTWLQGVVMPGRSQSDQPDQPTPAA